MDVSLQYNLITTFKLIWFSEFLIFEADILVRKYNLHRKLCGVLNTLSFNSFRKNYHHCFPLVGREEQLTIFNT